MSKKIIFSRVQVFVLPIKAFFVVLNLLQLAYLGVMFDTDPSQVEVTNPVPQENSVEPGGYTRITEGIREFLLSWC